MLFEKQFNRFCGDTRHRSTPSRMNRRYHFLCRSNKEDRHTIGSKNTEINPALLGQQAIGFACFFKIPVFDFDDMIAMHLRHRNDTPAVNSHGTLHIAHIFFNDMIIVADTKRKIQSRIGAGTPSTSSTQKTVQQFIVFLPLWHPKACDFHNVGLFLVRCTSASTEVLLSSG